MHRPDGTEFKKKNNKHEKFLLENFSFKNVDLVFSAFQDYSFINLFENTCVKLNGQNPSILWNKS